MNESMELLNRSYKTEFYTPIPDGNVAGSAKYEAVLGKAKNASQG